MTTPPPPPAQQPAVPRGRGPRPRLRRSAIALTFVLPVVLGGALSGLYWTLQHERGTAWLLQQVPGLQIEAPRGSVLGDFSARRLVYTVPGTTDRVTIEGLRWQGLGLSWSSVAQQWGTLDIARLHADRIDIAFAPSAEPGQAPTSLAFPLAVRVAALEVDQITLPQLAGRPLRQVRGSLDLSAEEGRTHRVKLDALQWEQLRLAGQASAGTSGAMAIAAELSLQPTEAQPGLPDWRGGLRLNGPLKTLQVQADLQAAGQGLQAAATVQPFAPWPLAALQARAEQLDLSALIGDLPKTALSGSAELQSKGWSEPAELQLQLRNGNAGRWDQQRLPLQSLKLALQGRPDQPQSLQLRELDAVLGSAAAGGGRLTGQGRLSAQQAWTLDTRVSGLRPAALDARLAPLQLDGKVQLDGAPDAPLWLDARLAGHWPAGSVPSRNAKAATPLTPVQLNLQASLAGEQLDIARAQIDAGRAKLTLSGKGGRADKGGWQAEGQLQLQNFDPRLLWAGGADSAWQRSSHSLNAEGQFKLLQAGDGKSWPQGQALLSLQPSQLAGVALGGKLDYARAATSAAGEALLSAQLELGGNKLLALSRLGGTPAAPAIDNQLEFSAPRLAALNPLLALAGPGPQLGGTADGKLNLKLLRPDATWQFTSDGHLDAQKLQLSGPLQASLDQGRLRWATGSRLDSPLVATAELERLGIAGQLVSRLSLDLQGSWAEHRLKATLQGMLSPPAAGQRNASPTAVAGEAQLALTGRLSGAPLQFLQDAATSSAQPPLAWRARIAQLQARPSNPKLPAWLTASELDLDLQLSPNAGLAGARIAPGRIEVAGAQLSWSDMQWQAPRLAAEPAQLRAEIEMAPFALAPLLRRWQPDFGWGGSLVVGGRASIRMAPQLDIDLVLERSQGDLSVTDERGEQALGLTDLRLGLTAHDGLWQLTQALAGTNLGSLGGAITVHADPRALWPAPDAPLEGVLQANVANLGTWGAWVPAGWRLGGSLAASMQMRGKVGAPELLGQADGSRISLRNPLMGVNLTEGAIDLSFNGTTAKLNLLSARGGSGTLTVQGEARLGEQPSAKLQLKADKFVLLSRVDRRLQASGQAQLDLDAQTLQLDGRFRVDEGLFDFSRADAPTLDDDVYVLRPDQLPEEAQAVAPKASERKHRISLAVDLGNDLKLRGRGLDSRLRGEVKLTQTSGPLQLNGVLRTYGGTYAAYGQKLEIERGEITFVGPYDNPRLDVQAVRPNTDTRVGVTLGGTAMNPRIKLFSEPEMSDTDKLSWLVLGRGPDGLGRADTALLQRAALALLSGEGESTSAKLIKNIGLDELSVSQGEGETDTRGTIVRVGKQLSRRLYVSYERGLNTTLGSWQLTYRVAQRFTLRAQTGEDNALDLIWQWKWE